MVTSEMNQGFTTLRHRPRIIKYRAHLIQYNAIGSLVPAEGGVLSGPGDGIP